MTGLVSVCFLILINIRLSMHKCAECSCCRSGFRACDAERNCVDGCMDGYYGSKCTDKCLENCKTCVNGFECTECKPGYYTNKCKLPCGKGCINNICQIFSGECQCKSTDFVKGKCDYCIALKYGDDCNNTCPANCVTCTSDTQCSWCISSIYYGSFCQFRCSAGCHGQMCNKGNGNCIRGCKSGFTGDKCDTCTSGFYGTYCDLNCTENCAACSSESNCSECESGFYGEACTNTCPSGCKSNCSVSKGSCWDCKHGLDGEFCNTTCADGTYGLNCSQFCREIDSNCQKCITDELGLYARCTNCKIGYYPVLLYKNSTSTCASCPNNCKDKVCDLTGLCKNGCIESKWGNKCSIDCHVNCEVCSQRDGKCFECTREKFLDDCSKNCSTNCNSTSNDRVCAQDTGNCLHGCKSSSEFGKYCEKQCSHSCNNQRCDWKTGQCSEGCVRNYYGLFCDNECPLTCLSITGKSMCNDNNGYCSFGCRDGFHGNRCDEICSTNCVNMTCNKETAECLYGCIGKFKGPKCLEVSLEIKSEDFDGHTTGTLLGAIIGACLIGGLVGVTTMLVLNKLRQRKTERRSEHEQANTEGRSYHGYTHESPVTYEDLRTREDRLYSQISTNNALEDASVAICMYEDLRSRDERLYSQLTSSEQRSTAK